MSASPRHRADELPPLHAADLELAGGALAGRAGAGSALAVRMAALPRLCTARNLQLGEPLDEEELERVVARAFGSLRARLTAYDGSVSLEHLADRAALPALLAELEAEAEAPAPSSPVVISGPQAEWRSYARLHDALDALGAREPEAARLLRMRHVEGLSYDELRERLGVLPGTARTRACRGLRALTELLDGGRVAEGAHPELHEELLPGLMAEAREPREALAGSQLEGCAVCRQSLESTIAVADLLERMGRDTRTSSSLAESVRSAPGEDQVAEAVAALSVAPSEEPRRVPWLALVLAVLAAGAVFALFVFDPWTRAGEAFGHSRRSSGAIRLEAPLGAIDAWGPFAWDAPQVEDGWFVVRVLDPEGELLSESPPLHEPLWIPSAAETVLWPQRIQWEVRLHDTTAAEYVAAYGEAWLTP